MGTNDETVVNPAATKDGASQLTTVGESLSSKFHRLKGTIDALNAAQPWGDDDPGKEFNKNYLGGDDAPAQMTLDAGKNVIDRVAMLGPDVKSSVEGTLELDEMVAKWFPQTGK